MFWPHSQHKNVVHNISKRNLDEYQDVQSQNVDDKCWPEIDKPCLRLISRSSLRKVGMSINLIVWSKSLSEFVILNLFLAAFPSTLKLPYLLHKLFSLSNSISLEWISPAISSACTWYAYQRFLLRTSLKDVDWYSLRWTCFADNCSIRVWSCLSSLFSLWAELEKPSHSDNANGTFQAINLSNGIKNRSLMGSYRK